MKNENAQLPYITHIISGRAFKTTAIWMVIILLAAAGIGYGWYSSRYVSTDDAYVNAHIIQIAPQVSGRVNALKISNNQYVQKDSILFTIDPTPFQQKVEQAKAQLAMAQVQSQNAQVPADNFNNISVDLAQAQLAQAQLNVEYTTLTAPTNGWLSNMSLREGDIVRTDELLFALISDEEFWIDANFKETQLRFVQIGQKAQVEVDMYPGKKFKGMVESISGASGNAFSLLPPQNATGNWVKVTQRVPVRVRIMDPHPDFPLRVGTSARVVIHIDQEIKNIPKDGIALP